MEAGKRRGDLAGYWCTNTHSSSETAENGTIGINISSSLLLLAIEVSLFHNKKWVSVGEPGMKTALLSLVKSIYSNPVPYYHRCRTLTQQIINLQPP